MVRIERLSLTYNNVYAVGEGADRILIDTGPDYPGAAGTLDAWLDHIPPALVVATHGHLDHAGLGRYWTGRRVSVFLGEGDHMLAGRPPVSEPDEFAGFVDFAEKSGAPGDVVETVIRGVRQRRKAVAAAYAPGGEHAPSAGGRWPTELRMEPFVPGVLHDMPLGNGLRAILSPGHTPGNAVVVHDDGILFSGDQLLPDITPTPSIQVAPKPWTSGWRYRSLPHFVESLKVLDRMQFSRCWPGHGEPFDNVNEVIALNLSQIEERMAKVLATLQAAGPSPVYVLAERLYPRALQRRFWQIIATVQGHLDLLEQLGAASFDEESREWAAIP